MATWGTSSTNCSRTSALAHSQARRRLPETVAEALARAVRSLQSTSSTPRADAQILLAHVLGCKRDRLIAHAEWPLDDASQDRYRAACRRRASGIPVAYITGSAGFYGREFMVNENVLVPRPETELLAEESIAFMRGRAGPSVYEAGVGSGALACTIAAEVPQARVEGSDISAEAIAVAAENARRLHVEGRCRFFVADVAPAGDPKRYDLIVANLPYIPTAMIPPKPDPVAFEPRQALDGGPDGLAVYRKLLTAVPRMLRREGLLLMEAAPPTAGELARLTHEALPSAQVAVRCDYAGAARYVRAELGQTGGR